MSSSSSSKYQPSLSTRLIGSFIEVIGIFVCLFFSNIRLVCRCSMHVFLKNFPRNYGVS